MSFHNNKQILVLGGGSVFDLMKDENGDFDKYKARHVANGFIHVFGSDYW